MRKRNILAVAAMSVALATTHQACYADNREEPRARMEGAGPMTEVDRMLQSWPSNQRETAHELIQRYGRADEVSDNFMVWHDNGPWEVTVLMRNPQTHNWPSPHVDYLQQFVRMKVPVDKIDDLARFDGSVYVDRTAGLVSARCGGEAMNYLALNLAHEVANGKKTVAQARKFYEKIAKSDAPSKYTEGLLFEQPANTADPDRPE